MTKLLDQTNLELKKQIYQDLKHKLNNGIIFKVNFKLSDRWKAVFGNEYLSELVFKIFNKIPLRPYPPYSFLNSITTISFFPDENYLFEFYENIDGNCFFKISKKELDSIFANPFSQTIFSLQRSINLLFKGHLFIKVTKISEDDSLRKRTEEFENLLHPNKDPDFNEIDVNKAKKRFSFKEDQKLNELYRLKKMLIHINQKCINLNQISIFDQKYQIKF